MALNNTYIESNKRYEQIPIPDTPGYIPPSPPTPPTPGTGSTPSVTRPSFTGTTSVTFYMNTSDNRVMNKSITQVASDSITFKQPVDLIQPTLIIHNDNIVNSNYMYMLGRYYYINSTECMPGDLIKVNASVDVLMTYSEAIKNNTAIISRNSNNVNNYINDNKMKITAYTTVNTLKASGGFSNSLNYYLLATGE